MPLSVVRDGRRSDVPKQRIKPDYYEMEIPRRVTRALGPEAKALSEMPVDKAAMLFFPMFDGMSYEKFSSRMGSHVATARRNVPGSSYVKRYVEIEGKGGMAIWRVK